MWWRRKNLLTAVEPQGQPSWGDHPCPELQDSHTLNPWNPHRTNTRCLHQTPETFGLCASSAKTAVAFGRGPETAASTDVSVLMVPSRGPWV